VDTATRKLVIQRDISLFSRRLLTRTGVRLEIDLTCTPYFPVQSIKMRKPMLMPAEVNPVAAVNLTMS